MVRASDCTVSKIWTVVSKEAVAKHLSQTVGCFLGLRV